MDQPIEKVAEQVAGEAQAWADGSRSHCGVVVSAGRVGTRLGQASLWGIDCDESSVEASADELAEEAIAEAREKLAALAGGRSADDQPQSRETSVSFTFKCPIRPIQIAEVIASYVEHDRGSIEAGGMLRRPLKIGETIVGRVHISIPLD